MTSKSVEEGSYKSLMARELPLHTKDRQILSGMYQGCTVVRWAVALPRAGLAAALVRSRGCAAVHT